MLTRLETVRPETVRPGPRAARLRPDRPESLREMLARHDALPERTRPEPEAPRRASALARASALTRTTALTRAGALSRSSALTRASAAAMLICVPLLAPLTQTAGGSGAEEFSVAPPVPLAAPARVVRVEQPVPAAVPVGLSIPAIGIEESGLVELGLDADGRLQAPEDYDEAGWFSAGPAPGDLGPAVLVGHVDSRRGPAVFYDVRELVAGDEIVVPRADGTTVRFVVDAVEQYSKDAFPAERVYGATADAQLRVITCGGSFDRSARSYRDNIVVYASVR